MSGGARATLPAELNDEQFWQLTTEFAEPDGVLAHGENLVSDESFYDLDDLVKTVRSSGLYLGVGPEQNFTYIATIKPQVAFIVDIRRENRDLHLMYKALFEILMTGSNSSRGFFPDPSLPESTGILRSIKCSSAFGAVSPSEVASRRFHRAHLTKFRLFEDFRR